MTNHNGTPPSSGFAALAPELIVADLQASLSFWVGILGFDIAYQRPEERFAYLQRIGGAQVMLCQQNGKWETASLEPPFGRGVMFQIKVHDFEAIVHAIRSAQWPIHTGPREVWRQLGDRIGGATGSFRSGSPMAI